MTTGDHDLWVFGYGSLMWRPGFVYEEKRRARLNGYRRCFCIYSVHHRGAPERLGMVLGLDRGGACEGIAYRVAAARAAQTVQYLRGREQVSGVYREAHVTVELEGGERREATALTYIVERAHPSYAGQLPLALQARLIRGGRGVSGANIDYFMSTLRHLRELGIREPELERLLVAIGPLAGRCNGAEPISPYAAAMVRAARAYPPPVQRNLSTYQRRRFLYRLRLGAGAPAASR
jgi:glutathione-specific gamma-glutamylcyclotransferase